MPKSKRQPKKDRDRNGRLKRSQKFRLQSAKNYPQNINLFPERMHRFLLRYKVRKSASMIFSTLSKNLPA